MKPEKRPVDILVLSDIHLGTYGCHAKDLLRYLKSIQPRQVVLNGDVIDIWQFSKKYWPKSHMKVIKHLMGWMGKGIPVYYVTGNHDEMLRRFAGFQLGTLQIVNKIVLKLPDNKRAWVFHGDVFDVTMQHSKWLAKLGAIGYDTLILINKAANFFSQRVLGRGKLSLSKRIKNSVKSAIKFINDFEQTAAEIAIANGYDYVICGHIHQPDIRQIHHGDKSVIYLNSGDWIENLTALEYTNGEWQLYRHPAEAVQAEDEETDPSTKELFNELFQELTIVPS